MIVENLYHKRKRYKSNSNLSLKLNARGGEVVYLPINLNELDYTIPKQELDQQVFRVGTPEALLTFQAKYRLARTGSFDEATGATLTRVVTEEGTEQNSVEGCIFFDHRLPTEDVSVQLYRQSFSSAEKQLGESKTEDQEYYSFTHDPGGKTVNLEARTVARSHTSRKRGQFVWANAKTVLNIRRI